MAALAAGLPLSVDLTKGRRKNQGQSCACSAHSLTKGILNATGFDASDHVLYVMSGAREGDTSDDGRQLVTVLDTVRLQGVAPYEGDSPDGRYSDTWTAQDTSVLPPNVATPATAEGIALAADRRIDLGQSSIDPKAPDLQTRLMASLAAGHEVYLGTQNGRVFENLGFGVVAQPDPANDPTAVGHALRIVGYRTNADASVDFLVENTWGLGWSGNGECWASLAWCGACFELHPLVPASPAPPTILQRVEDELRAIV